MKTLPRPDARTGRPEPIYASAADILRWVSDQGLELPPRNRLAYINAMRLVAKLPPFSVLLADTPTAASPRATAMDDRPSYEDEIEGKAKGQFNAIRITVTRYTDATLYDRMYDRGQISERQHKAAERLGRMWTAAGLNPRVNATPILLAEEEREEEFDAPGTPIERGADPDETGRDRYRRFMRGVPPMFASRLDGMLVGDHPGVKWLGTLQSALDWVADAFGISKYGIDG